MPPELDEFLSRAVDRQIAEQRALREALTNLRRAVEAIAARPTEPALDGTALEALIARSAEEQRNATREDIAALRSEIAGLRAVMATPPPVVVDRQPADIDLEPLRDEVAAVGVNIDGIAQALIDLNAGLRDWAAGVDEGLTSLVRSVNGVRAIADEARRAATAASDSLALEVQPRSDDDLDEIVDDRLERVEERIEETGRLAMNIRDRLEEFEKVVAVMLQLPKAVEGTVAQAVRRAMAARAKLDRDAEAAMDETLGALDEQIEAMQDAIAHLPGSEDQLRKVELAQIELGSRLDSLQESFLARLDAIEAESRRSQEALARAIDRAAAGRDPRAVETLARPARHATAKPKTTGKPQPARKPSARRRSAPKPGDER
jgi:hypothetical protein